MAEDAQSRSLEYTPTWIVAVICSIIVIISLIAERGLHLLGKFLKRRRQDALYEALQKLQAELMLLGFISLLLTVSQEDLGTQVCAHKGKVPLVSLEGLHQLHIFIFVLAVVHVIFCATTMVLGVAKISEWKRWEESIKSTDGPAKKNVDRHHYRQFFTQRTLGHYRKLPGVRWIVSFFKQFYGSVTKSDYIALRSGFIKEHCPGNPKFNFHEYMLRTLEYDFKKIVGISWYLWLFVVVFLLLNISGWYTYFWLSFLPLILLLLVGAHLEHIITRLARDVVESRSETVKPSDDHFWVIVQVLCSYSTLPLYAIVSQMGSMFKPSVFDHFTLDLISDWVEDRSRRPDSRSGASSHSQRLQNQPQVSDERITLNQGITNSVLELSSPIPEQV
ncbi:MLO-like protein 13 isoform X1 [Tanacetum coccineum]